jgi:hypothetical protein
VLPLSVLDKHPDTRSLILSIEKAAKALPEVDSVVVSFRP